MNTPASWRARLASSHWLVGVEFALIACVFVADAYHYIYFSKTPYLLALGWLSLALRGLRWRDVGLEFGPQWRRLVAIGLGAGIALEMCELFVTQPALAALTGKLPDLSEFASLRGNLGLLLILIGASWLVAGFGEELAWRGYVLNRLADAVGRSRAGWTVAVLASSLLFGVAHAYQDITGVVENAIDGALLALIYLACGRRLLPAIVAHGTTDTLDFLIIYSGHYPGMQ